MIVVAPEVLRERIKAPIESLSPRSKREVVSAAELAFKDIREFCHVSHQKTGAYLLVSSSTGVILHAVFEGRAETREEAQKLFKEALAITQMISMSTERVLSFSRGGVRGEHFIIVFVGLDPEADEAAALYVALQMDELTTNETAQMAEKTGNKKFQELCTELSRKEN